MPTPSSAVQADDHAITEHQCDKRGLVGQSAVSHARSPAVAGTSDRKRYLHSCSILSSAWARPLSEYWSVDVVPRPEVPFTIRSAPLRMASIMRTSSAPFFIQAPSCCAYIAHLALPLSAVASELVLNG